MIRRLSKICFLVLMALFCSRCTSPERNNPFDPGGTAGSAPPETTARDAALSLYLPLPKALVTVADSVVAVLKGPGTPDSLSI